MATFWERAAHLVSHMFSLYFNLLYVLLLYNFGCVGKTLVMIGHYLFSTLHINNQCRYY